MSYRPQLEAFREPSVFIVEPDVAFGHAMTSLCSSVSLSARHYLAPDAFWSEVDDRSRGCVVANVWLPGTTGLQFQESMQQRGIQLPLVMISSHPDVHTAVESLKRGAFDFLEKGVSHELLLDRILRAVEQDATRSAERDRIESIRARLILLSRREREVLNLLVQGKTAKEAATILGLSAKTVENHRSRIMEKTGAEAFAVLVRHVWEGANGDLLTLGHNDHGSVFTQPRVAAFV